MSHLSTFPIHQLVETGNIKKIRSLPQPYREINGKNERGVTALHTASLLKDYRITELLLSMGADPNLQTPDGEAPLHLAAKRGNFKSALLLIQAGANFTQLNQNGKSAIDLAKSCGFTHFGNCLLWELGLCPKEKGLVSSEEIAKNRDFPIHRAIESGSLSAVQATIAAGGVNQGDNEGNTPLHLAVQSGSLEIVTLLIKEGGSIDLINNNQESPLDFVLKEENDQILWFFLQWIARGSTEIIDSPGVLLEEFRSSCLLRGASSASSSSSSSVGSSRMDESAEKSFLDAYHSNDLVKQLFWLLKMANIRKNEFIISAHLINGAISLIEGYRSHEKLKISLLRHLERLEARFLIERFQIGTTPKDLNYIFRYREELRLFREEVKSSCGELQFVDAGLDIRAIQEKITQNSREILCSLIKDSISLLGTTPPTQFAVMILGSMARGEMCPYSDLEFVFLVDREEEIDYFRNLSEILYLKVVNMGETRCEIIPSKRDGDGKISPPKSLTINGFSMDIGGLSPLGKKGVYELIGTPKKLAIFQTQGWLSRHDAEIILVNAMSTTAYLMGEPALVGAYQAEIKKILNSRVDATFGLLGGQPLRRKRALELMKGYLEEFRFRLDRSKIKIGAFDIKKELYRFPQSVIGALGLYYNLNSVSTLDKIDELSSKQLIFYGNHLSSFFKLILQMRIKTQLFYQKESEIFSRKLDDQDSLLLDKTQSHGEFEIDGEVYGVTTPFCAYSQKKFSEAITQILKYLIPFYRAVESFVRGNEKALLSFSYDPEGAELLRLLEKEADQLVRSFDFDEALTYLYTSLSLSLQASSLRKTVGVLKRLQKDRELIKLLEQSVELLTDKLILDKAAFFEIVLDRAESLCDSYFEDGSSKLILLYDMLFEIGEASFRLGEYQKSFNSFHACVSLKIIQGFNYLGLNKNERGLIDWTDNYDSSTATVLERCRLACSKIENRDIKISGHKNLIAIIKKNNAIEVPTSLSTVSPLTLEPGDRTMEEMMGYSRSALKKVLDLELRKNQEELFLLVSPNS